MDLLLFLPVLLLAVVLHEYAHGWVAYREGDPTAERAGRLTLNPLVHIDPVGTVLVPLALWLLPGNILFGWAKPVPVNPDNYDDPVGGDIRVSLAGVAANAALAVGFVGLTVAALTLGGGGGAAWVEPVVRMARFGIFINLLLAVFNLVPLPPLDGSHVVYHALPARWRERYREVGRYGVGILLLVLFVVPDALQVVLWPVWRLMAAADAFIRLWI